MITQARGTFTRVARALNGPHPTRDNAEGSWESGANHSVVGSRRRLLLLLERASNCNDFLRTLYIDTASVLFERSR